MKSSGISLYFRVVRKTSQAETQSRPSQLADDYLINLIDSPGHVDFSSEVSTASRLCDGGLVLVDAVEGVCTQTHTVLRQAWIERVRPILVLNKIDRLITELKLSPPEAYTHLNKILEQVNAIMGTFWSEDVMEADAARYEAYQAKKRTDISVDGGDDEELEWELQQHDESNLYFSPEQGNVIFASAIDGWAFRVDQFAKIYATKLKVKEDVLRKVLWGEFYLDTKTKRVVKKKGAAGRTLFVQFVLENLWAVYDAVLSSNASDRGRVEKIVKALDLKVNPRDMKTKDNRMLLQAIMGQWLPLSSSVLLAVVEQLPSPAEAQAIRIPAILYPKGAPTHSATQSSTHASLEKALLTCDASEDAPTVVYISKMFSVSADMLPTNRRAQLTAEEMRERRKEAMKRLQEGAANAGEKPAEPAAPISLADVGGGSAQSGAPLPLESGNSAPATPPTPEGETLIGFARIYSGTIRPGQKLHVLGPKYDPAKPERHRSEIVVEKLYLMMGRELQALEEVPAGNVFGIGGLQKHVLKTGTLSSVIECPSFGGLRTDGAPIVRVALEPTDPSQMDALAEGLRLLNQADPSVEVLLQETGESVIVCAGELHLERCLKDLRESFAKINIQVSPPIVPFRETISTSPAIQNPATAPKKEESRSGISTPGEEETLPVGTVILSTPNKLCSLRVRAIPVPPRVTAFLQESASRIRSIVEERDKKSAGGEMEADVGEEFINKLKDIVAEAVDEGEVSEKELWDGIVERIWAFGPKRIGPNMLINRIPGYSRPPWSKASASRQSRLRTASNLAEAEEPDADVPADDASIADVMSELSLNDGEEQAGGHKRPSVRHYDSSIIAGFQVSTLVGPLCAEPMMGVCFVVEQVTMHIEDDVDATKLSLLSGQIISTMKEACRQAFLAWSPRLMMAMYSCDLQAPADVLGKVYAVLARRRGRILSEEMKEGTPFFNIRSMLPVVESFGFADDIRKRTSGAASPQLIYAGFEVLDQDPFWVPTTEEELEDLGEKADRENLAKKYMEGVRKRKGMSVEKKLVEHAEKQKTLKSK
ncbi:Elongation factor-like GTPase 1 [Borealophlyctis nickersoniae]|nr:Elongation factor-like GTPase 1 [Borealophlyctis nickersoniae]